MRNDVLINDVIKKLDSLILDFDTYYTLKNLKINIVEENKK